MSGSPNCVNGSFGFSAGPGFDQASGLGSPDAYNLIHAWASVAQTAAAVVASIDQSPVFEQNNAWPFTFTLSEEAGVAATVTGFTINGKSYNVDSVFGTASIPADGSISSNGFSLSNLAVPTNVVFVYSGTDARGNQWSGQTHDSLRRTADTTDCGWRKQRGVGGAVLRARHAVQRLRNGAWEISRNRPERFRLPQYLAGFEASVNGVTAPLYYVSPGSGEYSDSL